MDLFLSLQSTINGLADRCGCIGPGGTSAPPAPPRAHETRSIGDLHRPSLHTQFPPATPYRIASHRISENGISASPPRRGSHRNRLGRYETQRNTPRRHGPLRLSSPDPARGQLQIRDLPSARVAPRTAPHPTPPHAGTEGGSPPPSLRSPPHESRGRPEP